MGRRKEGLRQHNGQPVVIAIDFDHTICQSGEFPELGEPMDMAVESITELYEAGYGIVINTCRTQGPEAMAIEWLNTLGIPYDYVNCNFPYRIQIFGQDCRKISAEVYVDDKQVGGLPHWDKTMEFIRGKYF